ncbi:hypothetical protein BH23PAT1_BH23PAT1_1760 [soil metagenome]
MTEQVTPGYEWFEVSPDSGERVASVNLQDLYPCHRDQLQQTWESKTTEVTDIPSGVRVITTTFNEGAEGGSLLWLPGLNKSNLRGDGALVATKLAVLNPDNVVLACEVEGVPLEQKREAATGNWQSYAKNYMRALDKKDPTINTLSGHSLGGVMLTHLAAEMSYHTAPIKTISISDAPGARGYLTASGFAFRIGILDNRVQRRYGQLSSEYEEGTLADIGIYEMGNMRMKAEELCNASKQWRIIQAMSKAGLRESVDVMLQKQPDAEVFWWQCTGSAGVQERPVRGLVNAVCSGLPLEQQGKIRYLVGDTGHFLEGHTARPGRQTAYAIENTLSKRL